MQQSCCPLNKLVLSPENQRRFVHAHRGFNHSKSRCLRNTNACYPSTLVPNFSRAEFDICLKSVAQSLERPTHASANDIFALFDGKKKGILHVRDMASGLAVLCDGCTAPSILRACRLYRGASGDMGFSEIAGFTTSIFKVCCAARGALIFRLYSECKNVDRFIGRARRTSCTAFDPHKKTRSDVALAHGRAVALGRYNRPRTDLFIYWFID